MYDRIKKVWNNAVSSRILVKLMLTYVLTAFLPIVVISILYMENGLKKIRNEYLNAVEINLKQANEGIREQIMAGENMASVVSINTSIVSLLTMQDVGIGQAIMMLRDDIISYLDTLRVVNNQVYKLRVLHMKQAMPQVYDNFIYDPVIGKGGVRARLKGLVKVINKNAFIRALEKEDVFFTDIDKPKNTVVAVYKPIYSTNSMNEVGLVEVSFLADRLLGDNLNQILRGDDKVIVFNGNNEPIWVTGNLKIDDYSDIALKKSKTVVKLNGQEFYVVKIENTLLNSYICSLVPTRKVLMEAYVGQWMGVLVICFIIALTILASQVYRGLLANMKELITGMENVRRGKFGTRIPVKGSDEVGQLTDTFNQMTEHIQNLINKVVQSGKAEKEAVYNALSNQIKPHFLNNALDMVRMRAVSQERLDISQPIELIMRYFAFNMGKKDKLVTLEDELKNIDDYVNIYIISRDADLLLEIRIDEEIRGNLEKWEMLKFTLQPVVENCIKHGFKDKKGKCRVFVLVGVVDGRLRITVEDNGIGITPERLSLVKAYINGETDIKLSTESSGIGLRNIKQRLELHYGTEVELSIDSYQGVGTSVEIHIPSQREGYLA